MILQGLDCFLAPRNKTTGANRVESVATAFIFKSLAIVVGAGICIPALSGCVRTDDGTVLLSDRTAPTRLTAPMDPARYSQAVRDRRDREARAANFPHPPRAPTYRWRDDRPPAPRIAPVHVGVTPPFRPSAQSDDLTCRNETTADGRVRVRCD